MNEGERAAFLKARRDVFPDDVRQDIKKYEPQLLLWTGIVKGIEFSAQEHLARVRVEHHYWDWIEDHSFQREIAFLSPRGEGLFECLLEFPTAEDALAFKEHLPPVGDMAIAYGMPLTQDKDGVILLRCVILRAIKQGYYATDIMDYGRDFLLKGDSRDGRILRVP